MKSPKRLYSAAKGDILYCTKTMEHEGDAFFIKGRYYLVLSTKIGEEKSEYDLEVGKRQWQLKTDEESSRYISLTMLYDSLQVHFCTINELRIKKLLKLNRICL